MLDKILDQAAAAARRRDELVGTLKPRIHELLGKLFDGMIARDLPRLTLQIADEDGVRRFALSVARLEKFEGLYQVRIGRKSLVTPPLLQAEMFAGAPLRGITKPLEDDDVAELYTFLADLQNEEGHAQLEITADAVAILLKPRAH